MSLLRIFFAWVLSVFFGSLLLLALGGHVGVISFVFSSVCSLPTLLALLIVGGLNSRKNYITQWKRINLTHIIMFVLMLIVGYFVTENIAYIWIVSYYAFIAVIIWIVMFGKEIREAKKR